MILLALGVQGEGNVEHGRQELALHLKLFLQRLPQPVQQAVIDGAHRQDLQLLHCDSTVASSRSRRLQPYFFSLWWRVTRSMPSTSAARVWLPPHSSSTRRMWPFSTSSRLRTSAWEAPLRCLRVKSASRNSGSCATTIARSTAFSNSR